ncbi:MAG: cell filamentation protein Fic [Legionellales bacterium]|nr:MAG: cell filamentation protein Fic [Legionellales bacterium]
MDCARFSWNTTIDMINRPLPESNASFAGYAELIDKYELYVPMPVILAAISTKHTKYATDAWQVFTPRHAPEDTLYGHLVFALRYEGMDLAVLNKLFDKISPRDVEPFIIEEPNGIYARKIWFLYEYLQDVTLNIPDIKQRAYVDLVDHKLQYVGPSRPSKRHRINNNLPGVKDFCPLVRRTKKLDKLIKQNLSNRALENVGSIHSDILMRAAAFLLLEDSKASYAIEGETPPHNRAERWGRVIGQAGQTPLSKEGLERLQKEVIVDSRFIHMGYRKEGGFIGAHDRATGMPLPNHISARFDDLERLMNGLIATTNLLKESDFPPVLSAAIIAFGFVFIHPFEDGNGRLHRYLLHHVLLETGFTPKGMVFPVSSVILKNISAYRTALEDYSKPRLSHIEWRATDKGNVEVLNETIDLYRFFDATPQAEFFYECVYETITKALPEEVKYLQNYDLMKIFVNNYIDMPDRTADLLIRFLHQNNGKLSKRAREKEFAALTTNEIQAFENKFQEIFGS